MPLWSRVNILDGFTETKDLLPITGDKSTKNKVMMMVMMMGMMMMVMMMGMMMMVMGMMT